MKTMAMAALALLLQQESADDWVKFKKDTTWVYEEIEGKEERKTTRTLKFLKEDKGRATLEAKSQSDGAMEEDSETLVWYVEEGVFSWGLEKEGKVEPLFRLLKLGSKKGDTWKIAEGEVKGEAKHLGTAEVKVPAGTYKEAIHIEITGEVNEVYHFYLVPKVGLVKVEMQTKADGSWRFELKGFKEGK